MMGRKIEFVVEDKESERFCGVNYTLSIIVDGFRLDTIMIDAESCDGKVQAQLYSTTFDCHIPKIFFNVSGTIRHFKKYIEAHWDEISIKLSTILTEWRTMMDHDLQILSAEPEGGER